MHLIGRGAARASGAKGVGEPGLIPTAPAILGISTTPPACMRQVPVLPHRLRRVEAERNDARRYLSGRSRRQSKRTAKGIRCVPAACLVKLNDFSACDRYTNVDGRLTRVDPW